MLRALNRRRLNTPPDSLADSRNQDVDEVIADHIQPQEEEQRRLNDERLRAMMAELERETGLEIIMTPCSLLLIKLNRARLSQLDLVIFNLFRLDPYRLFQLGLVILDHNSHYKTYS